MSLGILIPVFNDESGLRLALDSLLAARLPAGTMTLVVDDGSTIPLDLDMTRYGAIGLQVLRLPNNSGIEYALNAGLALLHEARIRYVARLDAGDRVAPERMMRQLALLEEQSELAIVGSYVDFVDASGRLCFQHRPPRDNAGIRRHMHLNACLIHPSVMIRMSALDSVGYYSTQHDAAEDYELFFRLVRHGQAAVIPEVLTTVVLAADGISTRKRHRQLISRLRIQLGFFDARLLQSYLGIAMALLLLILPNRWVAALKRRMGSVAF